MRAPPAAGAAGARVSMTHIPDSHIIVRGGQAPLPEPGTVFSGAHGETLDEAAAAVPESQRVQ